MIAKIIIGNNFGSAVSYILDKQKNTEIIACDGVRIRDKESIIDSFNTQLEMNPNIKKPVYHISLDFSIQDINNLTNKKMSEIAKEYMIKMDIRDAQFIVVRHFDKEHPHIHLCINRIDNNGRIITNKNDRYRSSKACKELTSENQLYFASGKENVKRHRLKEPDKTKYEIFDALQQCIPQSGNWDELLQNLKQKGINTTFKYKRNTNQIEGVRFCKNGYHFNGSKIDRQYSFSKIDFLFRQNSKTEQLINIANKDSWHINKEEKFQVPSYNPSLSSFSGFSSSENENDAQSRKRKKRKKIRL